MATNCTSPSLGGLGVEPFLPLAPIPGAIAEWAALLPLVCHLASHQHDYQLAGEASLTGRVSLGLFPRLGVSSAIARFLEQGPDFLERAAAMGNSGREVWDVNWGSTFPCANGAACAIITAFALKSSPNPIRMPESAKPIAKKSDGGGKMEPCHGQEPARQYAASSMTSGHDLSDGKFSSRSIPDTSRPTPQGAHPPCPVPPPVNQAAASIFRRMQQLHVLDFKRTVIKPTWHLKTVQLLSALHFEILSLIFLLAIVVLLCLYGLYGSAIAVLSGVVSKVACRLPVLRRPAGFLTNNEKHDACMLVGVHRNCTTWYLYTGDRGLVDYLLNKPMIEPLKPSTWLSDWFKIAHIVCTHSMQMPNFQFYTLSSSCVSHLLISTGPQSTR